MQKFKKILFLLTPSERKKASLLFVMITLMALLDMIGVASILPFMAVLSNPSLIETNLILNTMFQVSNIFGVENNQQFLFALGLLVFVLLIFSLAFKAITQYALYRFVQMLEYSVGRRLLKIYLHQPYSWFLGRHSADLGKNILSEAQLVIKNGMAPLIELISKSMVATALVTLLIIADLKLALIVGLSLGGTYGIIFSFLHSYLNRIGNERVKNNQLRFKLMSEAFGAAKEVKVGGLEQTFIKNFSKPAQTFHLSIAYSQIISQLPRYILEAVAFGGVLLIILYKMSQTGSFINALPIISLYVFAGYRLMPAVQQIYSSFISLTFISPSIDKLYEDFKNLKPFSIDQNQGILPLNKTISLKKIYYNYPNTSRTALRDINLSIPVKSTVGIVGVTGCGKTTMIDIILGLLEAQEGTLEVDGKIITKQNSRSWQRSIGYVPQHIYLCDDTVAANIAFGVEPANINQEVVEKVSKIANLHEFIIEELPEKYETTIGERGVRLSGGQRQRIGIARALYHDPKVLILDEATSALDHQTEGAVMEAINYISKDITIIIVAHRLSTVKKCHKIFLLEKGQLKNEGTFEELIKINENFRINANNV